MGKTLSLNRFTYLFMATMAKKSPVTQYEPEKKDILVCCLPADYKQRIERIMQGKKDWAEDFTNLIDHEDYFANHFDWELRLCSNIKKMLGELKKEWIYSFVNDDICIEFTQKEVNAILNNFTQSEKVSMEYFADLVSSFMYTRQFTEAVQKGRDPEELLVSPKKRYREVSFSPKAKKKEYLKEKEFNK